MLAGMSKANDDARLKWMRSHIGRGKRLTAKGLAVLLKLNAAQVTRIMNGRRLRAEELEIIEGYIGEPAPGREAPNVDTGPSGTILTDIRDPGEVPFVAIIAPGVWREAGFPMSAAARSASAVKDTKLVGVDQYACTVEGEPMRTVICAPYYELRRRPEDGDLVHVVRFDGKREEHTLRIVRQRSDGHYLAPERGPSSGSLVRFPQKSDKTIEVRGLVIADQIKRRI